MSRLTTRGRVLCVDDEPDITLSLTTVLSLHGYAARASHDGPSALGLAAKFRPHACLLDIGMPGMDGYELAEKLRDLLGDGVVLVCVTARSGDEHEQRAAAAGFDYVLTKPADPDTVLAALAAVTAEGATVRPNPSPKDGYG